ncbi:hypothetical protein COCNU_scaffold011045G000010 [Cocos nucifera]|nr:hypothetical protein [Cocos nucifera]
MASSVQLRLMSDLKAIRNEPNEGCSASPLSDENLFVWSATIFGPDETPWEGGLAIYDLGSGCQETWIETRELPIGMLVSIEKFTQMDGTYHKNLIRLTNGRQESMADTQSSRASAYEEANTRCKGDGDQNIILNPQFEDGLNNWSGRGCKIALHDSMGDGKIRPMSGNFFASATERTQNWNGIQQEVTGRVQRKLAYEVTAVVRIFGNSTPADVRATLWVQGANGREQYIGIANSQATDKDWVPLQGKFLLNGVASKAVIYIEGPPAGTDVLLNSLVVKHAAKLPPSTPPDFEYLHPNVQLEIIDQFSSQATDKDWVPLQGKFLLNGVASKAVIYIEGPPAGTDVLLNSLVVKHAAKLPPSTPPDFEISGTLGSTMSWPIEVKGHLLP